MDWIFVPDLTYECGGGWRADIAGLLPAGRGRPELPWDDEYAERVFRGEFPPVKSKIPELPSIEGFVVLQRVDGVPRAVAEFQNLGHTVRVDFLNADGWAELSFYFKDIEGRAVFDDGRGPRNPGELFLSNIISFGYGDELDRYGNPVKSREVHRILSNSGAAQMSVMIDDSDRPFTGPMVLDIDVSGDGYWEPVATFGDWERWFVRDRPGVELFD